MSTTPERLAQSQEELRGDFVEWPRHTSIPATAAGTALLLPFYLDGRAAYAAASAGAKGDTGAVLRRCQLLFTAAVALNGTNFWTVNLNRYNAGVLQGSAGALGTFSTAATAITARIPIDIGSATLNGFYLQPGDYLELAFAHSGTGAAIPLGMAILEHARLGV